MIFIGGGALLRRSIFHTIGCGYLIDMVFSNSIEVIQLCKENNVPFKRLLNINEQIDDIKSDDKIVLSINNSQIFRKELLDLPGYRFYNIHNGIIPAYRGRPEICIIHAILNKEKTYGVSLHSIDRGIDTGICHVIKLFPISEEDTFESILQNSLEHCHLIFTENLEKIINNDMDSLPQNKEKSKLYTYHDLELLEKEYDPSLVARVLHFGVFKIWFRNIFEILQRKIE